MLTPPPPAFAMASLRPPPLAVYQPHQRAFDVLKLVRTSPRAAHWERCQSFPSSDCPDDYIIDVHRGWGKPKDNTSSEARGPVDRDWTWCSTHDARITHDARRITHDFLDWPFWLHRCKTTTLRCAGGTSIHKPTPLITKTNQPVSWGRKHKRSEER